MCFRPVRSEGLAWRKERGGFKMALKGDRTQRAGGAARDTGRAFRSLDQSSRLTQGGRHDACVRAPVRVCARACAPATPRAKLQGWHLGCGHSRALAAIWAGRRLAAESFGK